MSVIFSCGPDDDSVEMTNIYGFQRAENGHNYGNIIRKKRINFIAELSVLISILPDQNSSQFEMFSVCNLKHELDLESDAKLYVKLLLTV